MAQKAQDDIDNDTIEDDPFIGVSPSYTEGFGSQAPEAHTRKRRWESANSSHKRQRVSELNMMEKIGDGMIAIAKALAVPMAIDIPAQAESTFQGQAQKLIQESRSLTHAGTLIMLELLPNPELART
ncbi:hypothetical protein Golomagni_05415 [Golovinomyces magnicellulatus]|nr:hypothetical protein Golomagni_05415 [Golovinomyces magnicellulatus]